VGHLQRVSYCLLAFELLQLGHYFFVLHLIIIVLFIIVLSMVMALVQKPKFGRARELYS